MAHASELNTLVVAPAWVGDMVMAHTLIQRLAATSSRNIDVLAPAATAPLATRMAEVRAVHTADLVHDEIGFGKRMRLGRSLRDEHYAEAYVLPNSWKSALVPFFARIPQRIGWRGEARFGLLTEARRLDAARYPLMIERFMALGDPVGALPTSSYPRPRLKPDTDNAARMVQTFDLNAGNAVALAPGAEFGPAKKWPAANYAALADELQARGHEVWLIGSPKDAADCEAIAKSSEGVVNLAGETSLLDAVDLLSLARQAVCNDSGLMHIACALGVPTIGIFGSTSPDFTPPLGDEAQVAELDLDCRPCFQRTCPLGHLNCLVKLEPGQVIARLST
jgi:heptosyltransferase-2